jgi:hypothetical protein
VPKTCFWCLRFGTLTFTPLLFFSLADVILHIHMQALKRANQPNSQSSDPTADVQVNPTKGPRTKGLEHYGVGRHQKQPGTSNHPSRRAIFQAPHGLLIIMDAPQDNKSNDPLALPAPEVLAEIARKQEARAAEIRAARAAQRHSKDGGSVSEEQTRNNAALLIQKNYRGYKTRRAMQGRGLDPSVRWIEALKEGALYGQGMV